MLAGSEDAVAREPRALWARRLAWLAAAGFAAVSLVQLFLWAVTTRFIGGYLDGQTFLNAISIGAFAPLLSIAWLPAVIVFFMWQFRAAHRARSAGIHLAYGPGWGVLFWFIPLVQFVLPWLALRDLERKLAPEGPIVGLATTLWFFAGCTFLLVFPGALLEAIQFNAFQSLAMTYFASAGAYLAYALLCLLGADYIKVVQAGLESISANTAVEPVSAMVPSEA